MPDLPQLPGKTITFPPLTPEMKQRMKEEMDRYVFFDSMHRIPNAPPPVTLADYDRMAGDLGLLPPVEELVEELPAPAPVSLEEEVEEVDPDAIEVTSDSPEYKALAAKLPPVRKPSAPGDAYVTWGGTSGYVKGYWYTYKNV